MLFHWAVSNLNIQIHVTIHKQSNTSAISTNATYTTYTNTNSNTKTKKTNTTTYCVIKSYWSLEGVGRGGRQFTKFWFSIIRNGIRFNSELTSTFNSVLLLKIIWLSYPSVVIPFRCFDLTNVQPCSQGLSSSCPMHWEEERPREWGWPISCTILNCDTWQTVKNSLTFWLTTTNKIKCPIINNSMVQISIWLWSNATYKLCTK